MNSKQILFSAAVGLFGFSLLAQEKSKTYKETFNVSDDAVLEINTSHADTPWRGFVVTKFPLFDCGNSPEPHVCLPGPMDIVVWNLLM